LEAALLGADLGVAVTNQILAAVKQSYETQGRGGLQLFEIAQREVENSLSSKDGALRKQPAGLTVVSIVGVNGSGKTTTSAKLAKLIQSRGETVLLAACDTFRAAAIEQIKLWGQRLNVPVIAGAYEADPAAIGHDAVVAAQARHAQFLLVDTAGRLHTKHNLMQELQKVHRVMDKKLPGAPHETLLVLDATTGMNALNQAREFHKAVKLTGLVITKLDGTSKGGMVVAIQQELGLPIKFIGLGEQADDLQPFDAKQFAEALFSTEE
jgi:fused signal recognition particle receptor